MLSRWTIVTRYQFLTKKFLPPNPTSVYAWRNNWASSYRLTTLRSMPRRRWERGGDRHYIRGRTPWRWPTRGRPAPAHGKPPHRSWCRRSNKKSYPCTSIRPLSSGNRNPFGVGGTGRFARCSAVSGGLPFGIAVGAGHPSSHRREISAFPHANIGHRHTAVSASGVIHNIILNGHSVTLPECGA